LRSRPPARRFFVGFARRDRITYAYWRGAFTKPALAPPNWPPVEAEPKGISSTCASGFAARRSAPGASRGVAGNLVPVTASGLRKSGSSERPSRLADPLGGGVANVLRGQPDRRRPIPRSPPRASGCGTAGLRRGFSSQLLGLSGVRASRIKPAFAAPLSLGSFRKPDRGTGFRRKGRKRRFRAHRQRVGRRPENGRESDRPREDEEGDSFRTGRIATPGCGRRSPVAASVAKMSRRERRPMRPIRPRTDLVVRASELVDNMALRKEPRRARKAPGRVSARLQPPCVEAAAQVARPPDAQLVVRPRRRLVRRLPSRPRRRQSRFCQRL